MLMRILGKAVEVQVAQSCPTLCTVRGILQARVLEWAAFPFSRGSSQCRIEPRSPALQADSLPAESIGEALGFLNKRLVVILPGESQEGGSLVGYRPRGRTESDMTEVT